MFSKLLKHEWKSNAGLLSVLSLCALGVGLLGAGVLRIIIYMNETLADDGMAALAVGGLSSMMMFIALALVAYAFAVQFITLFRFYKNKFTDEGYLTFTLPVTARQIFLSSFLNILAWFAITVFVVIAAACIIVFLGAGEYLKEIFDGFQYIIEDTQQILREPGYDAFIVLSTVQAVFAPIYTLLLIMTSITIGSVLAKKHKILATIGIYYCINMVVGIVEPILTVVPTIVLAASEFEQYYVYMNTTIGITLTLQVILSVIGYFWSTWLMKHKLNLP